MHTSTGAAASKKWYTSTWFIILMLVFLGPVGIILMYKYTDWSKKVKVVVGVASAVFFMYAAAQVYNAPPTLTVDNASSSRIVTQDATYKLTGKVKGTYGAGTTVLVNGVPAIVNGESYSAIISLKEGDNTIIVTAKKKDKTTSESIIIHRYTEAELQAQGEEEAATQKAEQDAAAKSKAEADAAAAAKAAAAKAAAEKKAAEEAAKNVPTEYKSALSKATSYATTMHMSKQGVYDQLVSEYGEKFTPAAAQYGIDNVKADWNANALFKAKSYQNEMHMSPAAIHDQLTSEYGEKFTQAEADYAIQHL